MRIMNFVLNQMWSECYSSITHLKQQLLFRNIWGQNEKWNCKDGQQAPHQFHCADMSVLSEDRCHQITALFTKNPFCLEGKSVWQWKDTPDLWIRR